MARISLCFILLLSFAPRVSAEEATTALQLNPGEIRDIAFPASVEVRVSRRGVVDVFHVNDEHWQLTGLRGGLALVEAFDPASGSPVLPRLVVTVKSAAGGSANVSALPRWLCHEPGIRCDGSSGDIAGTSTSWEWFVKAQDYCSKRSTCFFRAQWGGRPYRLSAYLYLVEDSTARRLGFSGRIEGALDALPVTVRGRAISSLQALESDRGARAIGRPVVRMLPDHEVSIVSGGEFQVAEADPDSDRLRSAWKQHGLALKVRAVPLADGKARLSLTGSLRSKQHGDARALSLSSIDSVLDVKLGEPILAAALDLASSENQSDRTPVLADLPILGPLFRLTGRDAASSRLLVWLELAEDSAEPGLPDPMAPPERFVQKSVQGYP